MEVQEKTLSHGGHYLMEGHYLLEGHYLMEGHNLMEGHYIMEIQLPEYATVFLLLLLLVSCDDTLPSIPFSMLNMVMVMMMVHLKGGYRKFFILP